jgi:uncharacterized membrane protein
MQAIAHVLFLVLIVVFAIGAIGCAITIPIVAFKFFSVLFEKDQGDQIHQEYDGAPTEA